MILVSSFLLTLPLPKRSLPCSISNDSLPYDCPLGTVTPNCVRAFLALMIVTSLSFFALLFLLSFYTFAAETRRFLTCGTGVSLLSFGGFLGILLTVLAFDEVRTVFVQLTFLFNSLDGVWEYSFSRLAAYYFVQIMSGILILVLSFPRAPVSAAYNMFSPVNIFVHKNFPISFLKLRIAGQSVVRYSFSSVIIRTQRTGTIPMPSFGVSRHLFFFVCFEAGIRGTVQCHVTHFTT